MFSLFYRNLRLLILTLVLIIFWGLSSYQLLPRLEDPELTPRAARVTTFLPGANPYRVESLVTEKIEEELREIEEIETLQSTSRKGISNIVIELFDEIKEVDEVWSRIRDKVADASPQLPPGATEPEFENLEAKAYALIVALTWEQDNNPNYAILRRRAESLSDRLRALGGTEKVEIFGEPDEEIAVEIDQAALATLGLSAEDLSRQIQASDAKVTAGQLRGNKNDLAIEIEGELDSLDRIRQIPIRFGDRAQFVRLGDIAQVKKGIVQPPSDIAIVSGRPAIALAVFVQSSQRLDRWADRARNSLDEFRQQLPRGLELQTVFDQSRYVTARLNNLIFNLMLGGVLVFSVTLFIMGWQSAIVIGLSLPLSGLILFGCMRFLGIPLHQMSITGLIVALGLLIDNAIVVVDEVRNHLVRGIKPIEAIEKSIRYLAVPLLASTLTTVLAFLPIVLLPGGSGEFVGTIGLSVIIALFSSLFLALTIIPALTARLYRSNRLDSQINAPQDSPINANNRKQKKYRRSSWWQVGFSHPGLTRIYRWTLKFILARPVLGILLAFVLPAIGFSQFPNLEEQFFPPADRDQFQIELEMPSSGALKETRSRLLQARQLILRHPEVTNVHWFGGQSAPAFYYNIVGGREAAANYGQALVQLNSVAAAKTLIPIVQSELDAAFPEARIIVRQLEQGPPFNAPIEMRIYGSDLQELRRLGERVRRELALVANVTHTRANLSEALPQLKLRLDEDEVRLAGLDKTSVARQLETSLEGAVGGSVLEFTEELPVRVLLSANNRSDLSRIGSLDLLAVGESLDRQASPTEQNNSTNSIEVIPLSAVGQVKLVPQLAAIARRNSLRVNTVQAFLQAGVLPASVLSEFQQRLEQSDFQLPPGYSFEFGGEDAERDGAVGGLLSTVGIIIVLTIASLVLSLGSFRLASIIAIVGFCSIGLGLLSLWLFGFPFGFMAIIGSIGLVGIAINDSIVVLAALKADPAARQGNYKAAIEIVVHATRHVIATTLTTTIGFVPLLLDGGGFWPPLAVIISGGIGGATLLALYFVPSAYLLLVRRRRA
ncbi:MAG: efflux RND transporter permease subunit [Oscillatoria sp. SIO1A7]|nr:efflux RND transporter permease subunit [Oscillatoria sp. SIO1A7]